MASIEPRKKRRKARNRKEDEYCTFIIEIKDWDLTYLFSLNDYDKYASNPYNEYLNLEIKGIIREPAKYVDKEMKAVFLGRRDMIIKVQDKSCSNFKPLCVGSFTLRGDCREYLGSLPFDTLPTIASLLETKQVKFMDLHGPKPHYCRAQIRCVSFFRNYNPDEY
jgi:hypothetical protein